MGMTLETVSIASSGDTLPDFVPIELFLGQGHLLLERGRGILLEKEKRM